MYECVICQTLNHNSRTHCQNCGAVPAKYSMLGVTAIFHDNNEPFDLPRLIPVAAAYGSQEHHRAARVNLRTQELDYYADDEIE